MSTFGTFVQFHETRLKRLLTPAENPAVMAAYILHAPNPNLARMKMRFALESAISN